jgi:hypothetical protein
VKTFLEEIGIPELTSEQVEKLCEIGEKAARDYISSKIPTRRISALDITIDVEGAKPVTVNVDIEIVLSPLMKNYDAERLVSEAKEKAFNAIEEFLRDIACKSKG